MQAVEGSGPRTCEGDQMDACHHSVAATGGSWVWCTYFGPALSNNSEAFLFFLTGDLPDQYHLLTLDTMQFRGCELPTFWRLSACHLFRLFKLGSSVLRSNTPVEVKLPKIQIFSQMIWKFGALRMCFSQVCRAIRRISSEP